MNNTIQKKEYYGNILMTAPDGTPLASVDKHRATWYTSRGLAEFQDPIPPYSGHIRLKFFPEGFAVNQFTLYPKQTRCVVCGKTYELSLHHVVPRCIRRHFPVKEKSKNSQWCVLLCGEHHNAIERINSVIINSDGSMRNEQRGFKKANKTPFQNARDILFSLKSKNLLSSLPINRLNELLEMAEWEIDDICGDNEKIVLNKRKSQFGKQFIENHGGVKGVKDLFQEAFMRLNPKFLPIGTFTDSENILFDPP